jgi:hypothetical protein
VARGGGAFQTCEEPPLKPLPLEEDELLLELSTDVATVTAALSVWVTAVWVASAAVSDIIMPLGAETATSLPMALSG